MVTTEHKYPLIYYVDDCQRTLDAARAFFEHRGCVYRELHSLVEACMAVKQRVPTLVLFCTSLRGTPNVAFRDCFPAITICREMHPDLHVVTIAREQHRYDLLDSQLAGAIDLVRFSLTGLYDVAMIAESIVHSGGPHVTEEEFLNGMGGPGGLRRPDGSTSDALCARA